MGDLVTWRRGDLLGIPAYDLSEHAVAIGSTGSGKTEGLLRFAYGGKKVYHKQIIYIDAKGDERQDTPARFFAAMKAAGARTIRMFPSTYYNGWLGDATLLYNRLMAVIDYSESPYYGDVAADAVRFAVFAPGGPPRSSREFLANLNQDRLKALYKGRPEVAAIGTLDRRLLGQVQMRYRVFFGAIRGQLDGTLSYDGVDAIYMRIRGFALRDEAPRLGRFLALDYAHYVDSRKPRDVEAMLIIDEYNALHMGSEGSILFEQGRSFGTSVLVASQSYAGLGERRHVERMLGAANTYVLLRCSDPEEICKRIGKKPRVRANWNVQMGAATGQGYMGVYDDWKINPDHVRQQERGQAFIGNSGRAQQILFARVELTTPQVEEGWRMIRQEESEQATLRAAADAQAAAQYTAATQPQSQKQQKKPKPAPAPQNQAQSGTKTVPPGQAGAQGTHAAPTAAVPPVSPTTQQTPSVEPKPPDKPDEEEPDRI